MSAISGWGGRVITNEVTPAGALGLVLPVGRWTVTEHGDAVDVTVMEGAGTGSYAKGVTDYDLTLDCFWDTTLNPLTLGGVGGALIPGNANGFLNANTNFVKIELFLARTPTTQSWVFSSILVTDIAMDDEVRGVVRYTVTGKATTRLVYVNDAAPTVTQSLTRRPNSSV